MAPRTSLTHQKRKEASEQKILETARRLFSNQGFGGTSIRQIAREADIALGLMYNYFESKEVLLMTLFMDSMAEIRFALERKNPSNPPQEELAEMLNRASQLMKEKPSTWKLFFIMRMQQDVQDALGPAIHRSIRMIHAELENLAEELGWEDPALKAKLLFAGIEGICQQYIMDPGGFPIDEVMQGLMRQFVA